MKIITLVILNIFFYCSFAMSQDDAEIGAELYFDNQTSYYVKIQLYPVSIVFNGFGELDLAARWKRPYPDDYYMYYINGTRILSSSLQNVHTIDPMTTGGFAGDWDENTTQCLGMFGWGKYKLMVIIEPTTGLSEGFLDSCFIEWDYDTDINGVVQFFDTRINLRIVDDHPQLFFTRDPWAAALEKPISFVDRFIKQWQPYGPNNIINPGLGTPDYIPRAKVYGNFTFSTNFSSHYSVFPIDSRKVANLNLSAGEDNQNQYFPYNILSGIGIIETTQGILTNNLLISKNVSTPVDYWIPQSGWNYSPHCIPIVVTEGAKLTLDNSVQLTINTNTGGTMAVNIENGGNLALNNLSNMIYNNNTILENKSGGKTALQSYANMTFNPGSTLKNNPGGLIGLYRNSYILMKSNSSFCNLGGIVGPGKIYFEKRVSYCANPISEVLIDSSEFEFADSCIVEIPDSTNLIFKTGTLKLSPHTKILFGKNSKITIKNGAYISADSCTFTSDTNTSLAGGIILENAGSLTSITNSTFSNCKTAITIKNDVGNGLCDKIIRNNIFNIPVGADYGVYCENVQNILLKENEFNVSSSNTTAVGLYVKNVDFGEEIATLGETGTLGLGVDGYGLHIVNNSFTGGLASAVIANYLASMPNCYIFGNSFASTAGVSFVGRLINGHFKYNTFDNTAANAVFLYQSSPHFFRNNFTGDNTNVILAGDSYPNFAPQTASGTSYWRGGNNTFTSNSGDNLTVDIGGGGFYSNYGNNLFTVGSTSNFNLYGQVGSSFDTIHSEGNAFQPSSSPISFAWMNTNDPVAVIGTTSYSVYTPSFSSTVRELGYGVMDTLFTTSAVGGSPPAGDEVVFTQAQNLDGQSLYFDAITNYKSLINNFTSSTYLGSALSEMHKCYGDLDTNADQNYRDYLYGDLKLYLEAKISSGLYKTEFETDAYNVVLACETMIDPMAAIEGYAVVAQFHPDPTMRLLASWDITELEDLMNQGSSGGKKESTKKMKLSKYEVKRIKTLNETGMLQSRNEVDKLIKINELENREPVKDAIKKVYKEMTVKNEKVTKEVTRNTKEAGTEHKTKVTKQDLKKDAYFNNSAKDRISQRAEGNLAMNRSLNAEEKGKRQLEDLLLIAGVQKGGNSVTDNNNFIILDYSLFQNYPNPFNPVTNIKYSLPKAGFVSIKIYDVVGRMVKELVNEMKETGSYSVTFDGSQFASGVYFYRIEAGNFADTKRMVLVK